MYHQPRYDAEKKIYRDCRFCQGRGCIACPGEADKAYQAECGGAVTLAKVGLSGGPQPILTLKKDELPVAMKVLKPIIGPKGMMAAKAEGARRARKMIEENPGLLEGTGLSREQAEQSLGTGLAGEIVHDNIIKIRPLLDKRLKAAKASATKIRKPTNRKR